MMKRNIILILLIGFSLHMQAQEALTLERCHELAITNSEKIKKADISVRQAELAKQVAFTANLPKLTGSAMGVSVFPDTKSTGMELSMKGVYMAGLSLEQPLYAGGKITAANKQAALGVDMSREQQRLEQQKLITQTDQYYWNYVAVQEKVRLLQDYLSLMDSTYRNTQIRVENQYATTSDLLRIDSRRSQMKYNLQKAQNGAEICRMALCHQIGLPLDTKISTATTQATLEQSASADAAVVKSGDLTNRPEYSLLEKQISLNKLNVKSTRAEMLPTLGMSLGYNFYGNIKMKMSGQDANGNPYTQSSTINNNGGSLIASLSIPLFHFGEVPKKVKRAKLQVESSRLDLQENMRLMSIEREQALQNLLDSKNMISTAKLAQQQADENLRVMRVKYSQNYITLTDLMDAQTGWQDAHSSLIEALTQYLINQSEYKRVSGQM